MYASTVSRKPGIVQPGTGWRRAGWCRRARAGDRAELAAEVQAFFPVGAVGRELAARREVAAPRTAAGRHRDPQLAASRCAKKARAARRGAGSARLDAVADGVEEAVPAGGVVLMVVRPSRGRQGRLRMLASAATSMIGRVGTRRFAGAARAQIVPVHFNNRQRAVTTEQNRRMEGSALRHRLVAILAADAVGYSRLMSIDQRATLDALEEARSVFRAAIDSNGGRVVDTAGDSALAVFDTASGAATAALAIQQELAAATTEVAEDRRMRFRIGVHLGDVIEKIDGSVYGDGVNIAARLQSLAEPGGVTISDAVRGAVRGKVAAHFVEQGEQRDKNIAEAVRVYLHDRRRRGQGHTPAPSNSGRISPW